MALVDLVEIRMIKMSWEDIVKVDSEMEGLKIIEMLQADYKEFFQGLSEKAQRGEIDSLKLAEVAGTLYGILRKLKTLSD